jgi:hypothetical protein
LLLLILSGCTPASKPISPDEVTLAPNTRLVAFQETHPGATAALVVTRDRGEILRPCFLALHINGTLAARLDVGETARFHVPPGRILLRATVDPAGRGLCAMWHDEGSELEAAIGDAETKRFRLGTDKHGLPRILADTVPQR